MVSGSVDKSDHLNPLRIFIPERYASDSAAREMRFVQGVQSGDSTSCVGRLRLMPRRSRA